MSIVTPGANATSQIWHIFIRDSSSTIGAGLTGLVFNSPSLTAYYMRNTDTAPTTLTLATMTLGTFTSSGFKEVDATKTPGLYQFCPPDAAIAGGAQNVAFFFKGATNMAMLPLVIDLNANVATAGNVTGGVTTTTSDKTTLIDSLLNRDMSLVSDTNARSPLNALRALRNKFSTFGTTYTVCKEDDVTTAWTSTLTTDATATPITGSDPA